MASYLRSIFGSNSNDSSPRVSSKDNGGRRSKGHRSEKHSRSRSCSMSQVYAAYPPSTVVAPVPGTTNSSSRGYTLSSHAKHPSPLRFNAYDSSTISSKTRPTRPLELPSGTVSYQSGDTFFPYPIYTPTLSTSSRTNSGSSLYTSSASGHGHPTYSSSHHGHRPPMTPRTSSSGSVPKRPALKQTHTWHATESNSNSRPGPHAHVSFVNPKRPSTLHMHPLFASSHYNRAPISYDVLYPPSPRTIVDRNTRTAVPSHTLSQPATDPPTLSRLTLRIEKLPWAVIVESKPPRSAAKFYIGDTSPSGGGAYNGNNSTPVTNIDVLNALYQTLSQRATKEEWEALGKGSHAQRKISRAYDRRCRALGGGWDGGICRIDWLGEKTRLVGVEVDSKGGCQEGKLVFAKP